MHLIGQTLAGLPADLLGWMAVATGLAALGFLLRQDQLRKDRGRSLPKPLPSIAQVAPSVTRRTAVDLASEGVARTSELASIQARAALQIDAAEHALNQLLAECGRVHDKPAEPAFTLVGQPSREPATQASQPLAA